MEFEFDKRKSASNKRKHGIDFVEAQALWEDPDRLEIPAETQKERRFLLIGRIGRIGRIGGTHFSAVFTIRSERTRIISVRRAREEEVEVYES